MNATEKEAYAKLSEQGWQVMIKGKPDFFCYRYEDGKIKLKFVEIKSSEKDKLIKEQWIACGALTKAGLDVEVYRAGTFTAFSPNEKWTNHRGGYKDPHEKAMYMRLYMRERRKKQMQEKNNIFTPPSEKENISQPVTTPRIVRITAPIEIREALARWKKSGKPEDVFIQQGLEKGYGEDDLKRWLREAQ